MARIVRWGYASVGLWLAACYSVMSSPSPDPAGEYEPSRVPLAIQLGTTSRRAGVLTGDEHDRVESVPMDVEDLALGLLLARNETAYRDLPFLADTTAGLPASITEWLLSPETDTVLAVPVAGHMRAVPIRDALSTTLDAMRAAAERHLGRSFNTTALSVPHRLGEDQRRLVSDAAADAGLHPLRVVHEATAAAIGHAWDRDGDELTMLAFSLDGGGVLSVEMLASDAGIFELLASASAVPYYPDAAAAAEVSLAAARGLLADLALAPADVDRLLPVGASPDLAAVTAALETLTGLRAPSGPSPADVVMEGVARLTAVWLDDDDDRGYGCPVVEIQPLSLSVETDGGLATTVIRRFTPVPVLKSIDVLPLHRRQTSLRVRVFLGERALAVDNLFVGEFDVPLPRPADGLAASVALELGTDWALRVVVTDRRTGRRDATTLAVLDGQHLLPLDDMLMERETFETQDAAVRSLAGHEVRVGGRVGGRGREADGRW